MVRIKFKKRQQKEKKKEITKHRNAVSGNPDNSRYGVKINIKSFLF